LRSLKTGCILSSVRIKENSLISPSQRIKVTLGKTG
jgi:hypothetical protein